MIFLYFYWIFGFDLGRMIHKCSIAESIIEGYDSMNMWFLIFFWLSKTLLENSELFDVLIRFLWENFEIDHVKICKKSKLETWNNEISQIFVFYWL